MLPRAYYSVRAGKHPTGGRVDLPLLREYLLDIFAELEEDGCFQEWFGYGCVDSDWNAGRAGLDVSRYAARLLRGTDCWPLPLAAQNLSEARLFDVIEFLHDHASRGVDGFHHTYRDCGWHFHTFDAASGQALFRDRMNEVLRDYGPGYVLAQNGQVEPMQPEGLADLLDASMSLASEHGAEDRLRDAVRKYRSRGSMVADRRDAVRDLADVLERLRPKARKVLERKDEADLFELANRFGVRHFNKVQQTDYDDVIWLSWMFHHYLASIHACLRLIARSERQDPPA